MVAAELIAAVIFLFAWVLCGPVAVAVIFGLGGEALAAAFRRWRQRRPAG